MKTSKEVQLNTGNVNCVIGSYWIKNGDIRMQYKIDKNSMLLSVDLGTINKNSTQKEVDEYLSKFTIVIIEGVEA